jgi:hypothetical protein
MYRNMLAPRLMNQIGKLTVGSQHEETLQWTSPCSQGFADGVEPVQKLRLISASSDWCRRVCLRR